MTAELVVLPQYSQKGRELNYGRVDASTFFEYSVQQPNTRSTV